MTLYICQDYYGNVYITDDRDTLPPDARDLQEVYLPDHKRHESDSSTMHIDILDFSEIVSL
jgi:hypothetical protein